jgi:hypothetical protein
MRSVRITGRHAQHCAATKLTKAGYNHRVPGGLDALSVGRYISPTFNQSKRFARSLFHTTAATLSHRISHSSRTPNSILGRQGKAMENSRHSQQPVVGFPPMHGPLGRSFPSSQSIASALSPRASTPNSWAANGWLRGTPNTSPPSSGLGSPELKPRPMLEDGNVSPVEGSLDTSVSAAKNICFVGAGFVGMVHPCPPHMSCSD